MKLLLPDFQTKTGIYYLAPRKIAVNALGISQALKGGFFIPHHGHPHETPEAAWFDNQENAGGVFVAMASAQTRLYPYKPPLPLLKTDSTSFGFAPPYQAQQPVPQPPQAPIAVAPSPVPQPVKAAVLGFDFKQTGEEIFVTAVNSESPAKVAGVSVGQKIVSVNGIRVTDEKTLRERLSNPVVGQLVILTVMMQPEGYQNFSFNLK